MISVLDSAEKGWGLYSFPEVAQYLHVPIKTLRSWFKPRGHKGPLLQGDIVKTIEEGSWLNFHDFIQAYAVKALKDAGVKPRDVREAISEAKEKYGLPYPLSIKGHTIYSDGHGVHILPPGQTQPSELTGKRKGQVSWTEIIKPYLTRLEFDEKGMANKFLVFEKDFGGSIHKRVTMQPDVNFGEPTVEGTGYRASTLRDALLAEGSRESVVRFYEVDDYDVIVAVEAFKYAPELKAAA
jgi:uncharacterized protein (DUF433 family)